MASTADFVEYVAAQIAGAGEIAYKKMFGEYGFYCDGKFCACVSDNQFFVKITDAGRAMLEHPVEAPPYEGASNYFLIESLDNSDFLAAFVRATAVALPMPKPKKKKS